MERCSNVNNYLECRKRNGRTVGLLLSLTIAFWSIVLNYIQNICYNTKAIMTIHEISILSIILFVSVILSWRLMYHRMLCPYIIIFCSLYLCVCGQTILWAFGISGVYRDLVESEYWAYTDLEVCRALSFAFSCLATMHLAVVLGIDVNSGKIIKKTKLKKKTNYTNIITIMKQGGLILSLCTLPAYLIECRSRLTIISLYGYDSQFTVDGGSWFAEMLGGCFPAFMLTYACALILARKNNQSLSFVGISISVLFILIYVVANIMMGTRSELILVLLALLVVYSSDHMIGKTTLLALATIGVIGFSFLSVIQLVRSGAAVELNDIQNALMAPGKNQALNFVGEMGWNLLSTVEVQRIIESGTHGIARVNSYLVSFLEVIPNIGIWDVHPASECGALGNWLQNELNLTYGPGFTPVAEAYYNFNVHGFIIFIIWGVCIRLLNRKYESSLPTDQLAVMLFIGLVLKSAVRSSFYAVFRPTLLYVIALPILFSVISEKQAIRKRRLDSYCVPQRVN